MCQTSHRPCDNPALSVKTAAWLALWLGKPQKTALPKHFTTHTEQNPALIALTSETTRCNSRRDARWPHRQDACATADGRFVIRHSARPKSPPPPVRLPPVRLPSFVIRHSSFVIRHSSFVIRHSPFRHSPFRPMIPFRSLLLAAAIALPLPIFAADEPHPPDTRRPRQKGRNR